MQGSSIGSSFFSHTSIRMGYTGVVDLVAQDLAHEAVPSLASAELVPSLKADVGSFSADVFSACSCCSRWFRYG